MRETAQKSPRVRFSPVKDFKQTVTTEFAGGEGDGYFKSMGRRFDSCLGSTSQWFLVAQQVEQSAAQTASVTSNSPAVDFSNIKERRTQWLV
jgi:hypothetical protein